MLVVLETLSSLSFYLVRFVGGRTWCRFLLAIVEDNVDVGTTPLLLKLPLRLVLVVSVGKVTLTDVVVDAILVLDLISPTRIHDISHAHLILHHLCLSIAASTLNS